jgi:hypothetical protein
MKNTLKKFVAAIALFGALSSLWTQAAVAVYAEETQTMGNAVVAEPESQTETKGAPASNAVAAAGSMAQKRSSQRSTVRIDDTGIHVGGEDPVDINVPPVFKTGIAAMALLVPLAPFIMVVAIVTIALYFKHRRNKLAHETIRAMIEKGMPVTPELIAQLSSKRPNNSGPGRWPNSSGQYHKRSGLFPGLVLVGIGAALLISDHGHGKGGWIVLFIGVAFLVVWLVEGRNRNNTQPPQQ